MHAAEREPRDRFRTDARTRLAESAQLAAVVQQLQDLSSQTTRFRHPRRLRPALQQHRSHPSDAELASEHEAGRPCAHDDDVHVQQLRASLGCLA